MKKFVLIVITVPLFMGCDFEKENIELNQGLKFEEINKIKKTGFNFNKKNSYSDTNITKESESNKNDLHQGCTAPCCSE